MGSDLPVTAREREGAHHRFEGRSEEVVEVIITGPVRIHLHPSSNTPRRCSRFGRTERSCPTRRTTGRLASGACSEHTYRYRDGGLLTGAVAELGGHTGAADHGVVTSI